MELSAENLAISVFLLNPTEKRKKTMENNSQTKFSRHSLTSKNVKGKKSSKETQERKQARGTLQSCQKRWGSKR